MLAIFALFLSFAIGFLSGAIVFYRHGDRIVSDVKKADAVVQNVKETTKSL